MPSKSDSGMSDWKTCLDQFELYLRNKQMSAHTVECYSGDIKLFGTWYRGRYGKEPELSQLATGDFVDWKNHLNDHGGRVRKRGDKQGPAGQQTVNRKMAAAGKLITWAKEKKLVSPDTEAPKRTKDARAGDDPEVKALDKEQERALFRAVKINAKDRFKARDMLIIMLGTDCGLRVAEMAALLWSDIKPGERSRKLVVRHGKGDAKRTVPINPDVAEAFASLGHEQFKGQHAPILIGQRGNKLSIRGIQQICERYGKRAVVGREVGIKGFSVHWLRHTFGRRLAENGKPVTDIQKLMGHSDLKTTSRFYLNPTAKSLEAAVDSLAVGDRF